MDITPEIQPMPRFSAASVGLPSHLPSGPGQADAEVTRLQRRLERERRARKESETIAERAIADLYARQRDVLLLEQMAVAANEAETLDEALDQALEILCLHTGWPIGHALRFSPESGHTRLASIRRWRLRDPAPFALWREATEVEGFIAGVGLPGRVWKSGGPAWITDIAQDENFPRREMAKELGLRSGFALPVIVGTDVIAVLEFFTTETTPPNAALLDVLPHVGTQLGRVAEREMAHQAMQHQAYHDALTGLPNRSLFQDRLHQALAMAKRTAQGAAVLFLDLDRFKQINDTLGHAAGDTLLVSVARRLQSRLRSMDTLARMGGDEFMVLLPGTSQAGTALKVAQDLQEALALPLLLGGQEVFVAASIGVAMFPADGEDAETLLRRTDAAMYRCKQQGGGCQLYAREMDLAAKERLSLETSLRQAIRNEEFCVFYQPQTAAGDGRVVGMEALVRWHHPTWGMVPPLRFIPLAEEIGLILPLGKWVLEEALRAAAQWHQNGQAVRVAVNVSARQFEQHDFPEIVGRALQQTCLPPEALEIELTESVIMASGETVMETLRSLKALGIRLAIDDFGTGYSSLAYLRQFPVDVLKIDRAFVRNLGAAKTDEAVVRAVVDLAHALGLEVVAEGVETEEQKNILAALGCDVYQGYLFSPPQPRAEASAYLEMGGQRVHGGKAWESPQRRPLILKAA